MGLELVWHTHLHRERETDAYKRIFIPVVPHKAVAGHLFRSVWLLSRMHVRATPLTNHNCTNQHVIEALSQSLSLSLSLYLSLKSDSDVRCF